MAAGRLSCPLKRTFSRRNGSSFSASTCREPLFVIELNRYGKDLGFSVFFPQAIHASDGLYDATLSDGDCRLRVTLDPRLNPLAERNELRCGCQLRNVTFTSITDEREDHEGSCPTYRVLSLEVDLQSEVDAGLEALCGVDEETLPWFGADRGARAPSLLPLRARRSVYLPLWNNWDYTGDMWSESPPSLSPSNPRLDTGSDEEKERARPSLTLGQLRRGYLRSRAPSGVLLVRILNKSRLMYFGKADRNCECPYKAVLEVGDGSGKVNVVLWNSLCKDWYRCLRPGLVLRLSQYRVKESYASQTGLSSEPDIEISLNSRNPSANIAIISESSVCPEWDLPVPSYSFYSRKELLSIPHGSICDVIGVVVFAGRQERLRDKDGHGTELLEYRWLGLEDGTTEQPIMIQLFSTSQPELSTKIHPMSVVVCTRVKMITVSDAKPGFQFLTNTTNTQVYCTGSGHHRVMPYRKLHPVRQFIHRLQSMDEGQVLRRAVIGGFFTYPPLPVSLEQYMRNRKGEPGLISGGELKREVEGLQYRERRSFTVQATVTMVTHCRGREEDCSILCPSSPSSSLKLSPKQQKLRVCGTKRRFFGGAGPTRKRAPFYPSSDEADAATDADVMLWDASMEFLEKSDEDDVTDDEDGDWILVTTPPIPIPTGTWHLGMGHAAMETVPRAFCAERRVVQAVAVGLHAAQLQNVLPSRKLQTFSPAACYTGHYTLTLQVLSDSVQVDSLFTLAPPGCEHWSPAPSPHPNTWSSLLSTGAFSPFTPPPSPADLIAMATQLTNKRLVCILEACALGGDKVEFVLTRAFPLRD